MTPPAATMIRCLRASLGSAIEGPTDTDLLARFAKAQDQEAFELLVWRHAGMVMRVCRSILRDYHAAEDSTQAVFLALARQASSLLGRNGTVAGWLYRVAWRVAMRVARRRAHRRAHRADPDLDLLPMRETDSSHDPILIEVVDEELARLPEKYRVPLLLCFFEGLTHVDAGAGSIGRSEHLLLVSRGGKSCFIGASSDGG